MTRINVVPVEELSRQHLIAEYRELPRVFTLIKRAIERGESPDDPRNPREYTLGKGHVRFFYNKIGYLTYRFIDLVIEMERRGFQANFQRPPQFIHQIPGGWSEGYLPTAEALEINRERIRQRTHESNLKLQAMP